MRFNFFKILVLLILCFNMPTLIDFDCSLSNPLSGFVHEEDYFKNKPYTVVDSLTGSPVPNANIRIPSLGFFIKTDSNGCFNIKTEIRTPVIMSVQAKGYKPFSLSLNKDFLKKPLIIAIEKNSKNMIIIDSIVHHLGDDNFSDESEDAGKFNLKSSGPYFTTSFYCGNESKNSIAHSQNRFCYWVRY